MTGSLPVTCRDADIQWTLDPSGLVGRRGLMISEVRKYLLLEHTENKPANRFSCFRIRTRRRVAASVCQAAPCWCHA
ncbi:hypothetical protein RvY_12939 [Ramazzottius varieornatus]|uniref:Uncharacterized protein n=1 Tax=Ramazzottius varieornatus TaxID=947166 RepID=A0A1D1VQA2_RAMVA|nr:hypothetical protein RvY_12939 [Ramazzottius varieornatus]